jgi:hypothetical protein
MFLKGLVIIGGISAVFLRWNKETVEIIMTKLFFWSNTKYVECSVLLNEFCEKNKEIKNMLDGVYNYCDNVYTYVFNFKREPTEPIWISKSCVYNSDPDIIKQYLGITKTSEIELFENYRYYELLSDVNINSEDATKTVCNIFEKSCSRSKEALEFNNDTDGEVVIMRFFDKFIVKDIRKNKQIESITFNTSDVHFITVQYTHPKMKSTITLSVPKGMYVVGSELFTPTFVLRLLNYQPNNYIFDMNYVLKIIDNNVNLLNLTSNQYMLLNDKSYSIKSV